MRGPRAKRSTGRVEQLVQVHDDVFHFRIVNRSLRIAAPGLFSIVVAAVDASDMDAFGVGKMDAPRIGDPTSHDEVKGLMGLFFFHWGCAFTVVLPRAGP